MKKLFLLLFVSALVWMGCGSENSADDTTQNVEEVSQPLPPPPRPDLKIRLIDNFVDSLSSATDLQNKEKVNDLDPEVTTTQRGYYSDDYNFIITEQNKTSLSNQLSTFVIKDGLMVFSDHKMLRERCGHVDDVCMTQTRQYFEDEEVIWAETRYHKVILGKAKGQVGLEFFSLMDTVPFRVIPNLRESGTLYEKDKTMVDRISEEILQPLSTEQKTIILE